MMVAGRAGRGETQGLGRAWSVPGELGCRFPGAGIVDEVLAAGGGDERGGGGVVERPREPVGDTVQTGDGIASTRPASARWWRR